MTAGTALDIATAPRADSKVWKQGTATWDDMIVLMDNPADHKECGNYLPGLLKGTARSKDTILSRSMATLDADQALSSLPVDVALLGYAALVHTTWRSTPELPRYRVILQLDRSVTPDEYRVLVDVLMDQLGREQFDPGSVQPERYMFLPSRNPEHADWYQTWTVEGEPVPVDELLALAPVAVPEPVEQAVRPEPTVHLPEDYVAAQVARTLADLDALSALAEGERLPWPGEPEGVGWDRGSLYAAGRLVEAANSGASYTLDDAEADWDLHAPPSVGRFDRAHKWSEALKHVGARALPYIAPEDDFTPVKGKPSGEMHGGQVRMAYRLAAAYAGRLLYVYGIGWHYWDGHKWAEDDHGIADRAVVAVLRKGLAESVGDKRLRSDVTKCESAAGIKGVLSVAATLEPFAMVTDQMDADPFLVNCANVTLDLRDRTVSEHDPANHITKMARGAYDPDADQSAWLDFLERVLPDVDERDYLRRVIGQALYGGVREHLFPVLTGTGANGKGTTYGAICNALGDYATVISPELLMVSRGSVGGPEMMVLRGARLVVASELGRDRVLDDAIMKRLTGGDQLTARHLFKEPVVWSPTHQLLYVTNFKPATTGDDDAVWRRVRVIPFDVVIPLEERDLTLGETLMLHADAILTWAVDGYFDHEDNGGMREPAAVLDATAAYQYENDDMARFVEDQCVTGKGHQVLVADLWQAWMNWSHDEGAETMSKRAFGMAMEKRGFKAGMLGDGSRIRRGISLRAESEES